MDNNDIERWSYDIELRNDVRKIKNNVQCILILIWIIFEVIMIFTIIFIVEIVLAANSN